MGKRRKVKKSKRQKGIAPAFRRFDVSTFLSLFAIRHSLFTGVVFVSLAATLPGCAIGAASAAGTAGLLKGQQNDPPEALEPEVDSARARVPLDRIEPVVQRPIRSDPLRPLSKRGARRMTQARALIAEQRYTEAAFELEDALRYDPNHPSILRELAQLHWQAGNAARAKLHASRAIKVNPNDAVVHYVLGRCHASSGENSSAITQYRTALVCSDFGRDREAAALCQYHLAEVLAVEGYLEASLARYKAFEDLAASISVRTDDTELMRLLRVGKGSAGKQKSAILAKLGRFKEAADALAPQVAAAGDDFSLGMRYARLLLRGGRFEEARAAVRAVPSGSGEILDLLLDINRRAGHPDGAVEDLQARLAARPNESRGVLDLAEALVRLQRPAEARRELESFLARTGGGEAVRVRLVDLLITESKWTEALQVCAEGLAEQPDRAAAFAAKVAELASNEEGILEIFGALPAQCETPLTAYLRGLVAVEAGDLERAEPLLRECHDAQPSFTPARLELARLYLRTYRYADALSVAARADEGVADDAGLEAALGRVYERLDDLAQAGLHFKAALQLNRADPDTMFALAEVHRRSGDRLKARRQLRVLLKDNPLHEPARETLIRLYLNDGEVDVAREQFDEMKRHGATATTTARCGALLDFVRDRDPRAYRAVLIQTVERGDADAATWTAIAESYPEEEQDRAKEAYLSALALDGAHEEALRGVIDADRRLLNFELAVEGFEALLPRRPNRHSWRYELMELYRAIQSYDAALSLARTQEAREDIAAETRTRCRLELLETLELVGRREDVFRLVKDWSEEDPDSRGWRLHLAGLHLLDDQSLRAVEVYEELYRSDPDDATLVGLINALQAAGRHDRACQYTLDRLNEDPDNAAWMARLVSVLAAADHFDDAVELVRNKLLQTQAREQFQDLMIWLLNLTERGEEGAEWIEELMDQVMARVRRQSAPPGHEPPGEVLPEQIIQQPNEPSSAESLHGRMVELRVALARTLILGGKNREGEKRLTGWLDTARNRGTRFEYLFLLHACLGEQGKSSEAEETLEHALMLDPKHIRLNNDVAYGWIDRGVRLDEALVKIRYALSRSPRQPAYLDTYGWLLYKRGEFVSAGKWLLRAVRARDGEDPVILDHLGDACWRAGLAGEALTHWEGAAEVIKEMSEDELDTEDERRVRDAIAKKIEQARSSGVPNVAPTAKE